MYKLPCDTSNLHLPYSRENAVPVYMLTCLDATGGNWF